MERVARKYQVCRYCGDPISHLSWKGQDAHIECLHSHTNPVIVKVGDNFSAKIYTEVVGSEKVFRKLQKLLKSDVSKSIE